MGIYAASDQKKGTILIVDDIPENLSVLNDLLCDSNYLVRPALNGEIALKAAQADMPDLILLDVTMPVMDGFETCTRLKSDDRTKDIPIIFITSLNDVTDKVSGLKLGAVDYITKPFEIEEVLARVENHMAIQNLQRELREKNHELEANARLREEVENIMCHDLKGPIGPILSFPRIIKKDGPLTEKQSRHLRSIEEAGHRLLRMICFTNDILKMENGYYKFHPEPVDVLSIIENIVTELSSKLEKKELELRILVNDKVSEQNDSFFISGHELLAYSMLYNLIKNAEEASNKGQTITIKLEQDRNNRVIIQNENAVPTDIRDRFFEKYASSGKSNGMGLGTYSAKLAAQTQGGTIDMISSEEWGTQVTIRFPGQGCRASFITNSL